MPAKNLAIREDVYRKLLSAKTEKESFSDAIDRLLSGRPKLSSFSGLFADDKEFSLLEDDVRRVRAVTAPRTSRD
jgi:predicted CopG family antitoxin